MGLDGGREGTMFRRIILAILIIAVLAAGAVYLLKNEPKPVPQTRDLLTVLDPYEKEREALLLEKAELEEQYGLEMRDIGTAELLFREMDEQIFSVVYPVMRDHGVVGTLGISTREYPGSSRRLSRDQFSRLLMDGWGTCLLYERTGNRDFKSWYEVIRQRMDRDGFAMPTAVYFSEDNYDPSMNRDLLECGIRTVVLNAEDGHTGIVTSPSEELWITGAMPWNYTGLKTDLEILSRTSGANLVFTIGFQNLWDAYEEESFLAVMDGWQEIMARDQALVELISPSPVPENPDPELLETTQDKLYSQQIRAMNLDTARTEHLEAEKRIQALDQEYQQKAERIDARIAELDEKIRQIRTEWNDGKKNGTAQDS